MQKDRSLKLRSNFLSKCKPLGTIIKFILFNKCSHFNPSYSFSSSVTVDFTKLLIFLLLLFKYTIHLTSIAYIRLIKNKIRPVQDRSNRIQTSRICEFVHAHKLILRIFVHHIKNKITANKPSSAGDKNLHMLYLFMQNKLCLV